MSQPTTEYAESEGPAIALLRKLGYQYYNAGQDDERETIGEVVLTARLETAIRRINPWLNDNNAQIALREITSVPAASLMEANHQIHRLLSGRELTVKQVIAGREQYRGIAFIDFTNPATNDFLAVNQMKFKGQNRNSVPDIVLFVNGLPLAVIECKSPARKDALAEAISDLRFYQANSEKLFYYNQICAGIYRTGGRYAAIGAQNVHYQLFRADRLSVIWGKAHHCFFEFWTMLKLKEIIGIGAKFLEKIFGLLAQILYIVRFDIDIFLFY